MPELEAILTEDTTWTFTMPGQGVLGPVAGRAAVLDFIRDGKGCTHIGGVSAWWVVRVCPRSTVAHGS
nr:hypothetical protein [Streptomyces luteolifulvus]